MIEKYHKPIFEVISREGALGVNAIAKATEIPLSTIQKYLDKQQTFFRKTEDRKWDLPENVNADITSQSLILTANILENTILLIQSQLGELQNTVANTLTPVNTLKRGVENKPLPVAETTYKAKNTKLSKILEAIDKLPSLIKSRKENVSEELLELLLNTEWLELFVDLGYNYISDVIEPDLYELLLGNKTDLSEDTLTTIKEYQKGQITTEGTDGQTGT